ncbi:hypothetical protein [Fulvivirga sp.]|uniref:hypothetical protein n=2 Tax=Fulvivirga sp. TaxID=1931237 RepID=UPI0032EF1B76
MKRTATFMSSIKAKLILFSLLFLCMGTVDSLGQVEEVGASNSLFYYTGNLGGNEQLEFNMQLKGHAITGSCILVTTGNLYVIKGRLAADKNGMGVLVYDESDQFIASVEAKVISDEFDFAKEIKGVWKSANGLSRKNVNLTKIAELAQLDESSFKEFYGD